MNLRQVLTAAAASLICLANPALAERVNAVAGEKLDSGLGSLPEADRDAARVLRLLHQFLTPEVGGLGIRDVVRGHSQAVLGHFQTGSGYRRN